MRRPVSPRYREDGELPRGALLEEFSQSGVIIIHYCPMKLGDPFAFPRLRFQLRPAGITTPGCHYHDKGSVFRIIFLDFVFHKRLDRRRQYMI